MKNKQIFSSSALSVFLSSSLSDKKEVSLCHERYEMLYVISGRGKYILECEEYDIAPGKLFLSCPLDYRTLVSEERVDLEFYSVTFDKSALPLGTLEILESMISMRAKCFTAEQVSSLDIDSAIDRFYVAERLPKREAEVFALSLLSQIVALLSTASGERLVRTEQPLAVRVAEYINSNIHRDLSLDTLSHRFFVSKYYLCRAFKQQSGTSIHNYINQKRVLYAKQLIEAGETASSAADKVGFGDYSAFYRAYTKYQGISPVSVKPKGGNP